MVVVVGIRGDYRGGCLCSQKSNELMLIMFCKFQLIVFLVKANKKGGLFTHLAVRLSLTIIPSAITMQRQGADYTILAIRGVLMAR
jgi:hypothetical protein